jgi:hypothetical protein
MMVRVFMGISSFVVLADVDSSDASTMPQDYCRHLAAGLRFGNVTQSLHTTKKPFR